MLNQYAPSQLVPMQSLQLDMIWLNSAAKRYAPPHAVSIPHFNLSPKATILIFYSILASGPLTPYLIEGAFLHLEYFLEYFAFDRILASRRLAPDLMG